MLNSTKKALLKTKPFYVYRSMLLRRKSARTQLNKSTESGYASANNQ